MSSHAHVFHTTGKQVISRRGKSKNVCEMSKTDKCSCKACKTIVFHCQICKFVTFLLPSLSWLLKLLNNTWARRDMGFLVECSTRYLTSGRREGLALDNIGWSRTERKSSFPMSLTSSSSSRDRNIFGGIQLVLQTIQSEVVVDKSHRKSRESIPWRRRSSVSIFNHIYFCHERTMMTSQTSEDTIFVRFYFTLCYLMLTAAHERDIEQSCIFLLIRGRRFNYWGWGVGRCGWFWTKIPARGCRKKKNCMQHKWS